MDKINPFPGIRPFTENESKFFFGRDSQIDALQQKLDNTHFVSVVGLSASGKSSLVKAGLMPRLKLQGGWAICLLRPQNNPIQSLANALSKIESSSELEDNEEMNWREFILPNLVYNSNGIIETYKQSKSDRKLLIIIDQFEELFTYSRPDDGTSLQKIQNYRNHFVNLITSTIENGNKNIYFLITVRSDFIGDCSEFRGLPELINDGQFLVPRLTRNELKQTIVRPLEIQNISISPALLNRLLNDVNEDPDQLPILQHSLMRTFNYWRKNYPDINQIREPSYIAIGEMKDAIANHANEIFNKLASQDQEKITLLFKQITRTGDGKYFRSPTSSESLCKLIGVPLNELDSLTALFRKEGVNFLLPPINELTEDSKIDISHEALIRKWKNIQLWIKEEEEDSKILFKLLDSYRQSKLDKSGQLSISFIESLKRSNRFNTRLLNNNSKQSFSYWVNNKTTFKKEEKINNSDFINYIDKQLKSLHIRKNYKIYALIVLTIFGIFIIWNVTKNKVKQEVNTMFNDKFSLEHDVAISELSDFQDSIIILNSILTSNQDSIVDLKVKKINLELEIAKLNQLPGISKSAEVQKLEIKLDDIEKEQLIISQTSTEKTINIPDNTKWFKEGFFLLYDNIKVSLHELNVKENKATFLICEIEETNTLCKTSAQAIENLIVGKSRNVSIGDNNYRLALIKIDNAGKNPLTKAVFITFDKVKN